MCQHSVYAILETKPSFAYARQAFYQLSAMPGHSSWSAPKRQLFINVTPTLVKFLSHFISEAPSRKKAPENRVLEPVSWQASIEGGWGRWALGVAPDKGEDSPVTSWPGAERIKTTWACRTCPIRSVMNTIWSCQFLYAFSEGRTRFALITTSKHRLPAREPDEWEQIQNSFISLRDRTFLWNSALKTFYISVSFTHRCGHSYLCKPASAVWPVYHNLWVEDSQRENC